jgi:hypothetical protein
VINDSLPPRLSSADHAVLQALLTHLRSEGEARTREMMQMAMLEFEREGRSERIKTIPPREIQA